MQNITTFLPVGRQVLPRAHRSSGACEQAASPCFGVAVHPVGARPRLEVIGSGLAPGRKGHRAVRTPSCALADLACPVR